MKKLNRNNLRQGETVYLIHLDANDEVQPWKIAKYMLHSDKTSLPEQGNMIERMPRAFFRDNVVPYLGPGRLFYSRKKATRHCNRMNGVKLCTV